MANVLEYDFRVVGARAVHQALASLEQRFLRFNAAMARGVPGGTRAGGGAGAAGVARAQSAALDREQRRQKAYWDKANAASARLREREEMRATRAVAREEARVSREQRRSDEYWQRTRTNLIRQRHAEEERANRRLARERERTAHARTQFVQNTVGGGAKRIMSGVASVGTAGAAMIGIGGAALAASSVSQATKLDEIARRLSIQGRSYGGDGIDADYLRGRFMSTAVRWGLSPEEVGAGVSKYAAETGDLTSPTGALAKSETMATVSMATGANVEDVAKVSAHLFKLGLTSVEDLGEALATLTFQGKKGSFELKNMASELPEVLSSMAAYGYRGQGDLATIGGLMQNAMRTTANASESTTAVQNAMRQIIAKSGKLQSGEMFEGRKVQVFEGWDAKNKMRPLREMFGDIVAASQGDIEKMNDLLEIRGSKAFSGHVDAFRSARQSALKRGATEKQATAEGRTAALKVLSDAADVESSYTEIQRDAGDAMKATSVQLEILQTKFKEVLASQFFPVLIKVIPQLTELIPQVAALTKAFVNLASWVAENPIKGIGAAFAIAIAYEIAKAKIGALLAAGVRRIVSGTMGAGGASVGGVGGSAGTVAKRSALGVAAGAAANGLLIGGAVAAGIYSGGIMDFDSSEERMRQNGASINAIRDADVGSLDQVREKVAELRRQKTKLSNTSFLDDISEGALRLFGTAGGNVSSRQVELNTTSNMLAEAEQHLAILERQKEAADRNEKSAQRFENGAKIFETAATALAGGGKPNRGNGPSPIKN